MKKLKFLNRLIKEGKLELVEPSEDVKKSYLEKADNSLRAAKILLQNGLYENSVVDSYYAMYNSLLALLFKVGIKSENHSGSIILLKELFNSDELYKKISFAKEERIDKQYYVASKKNFVLTEDLAKEMGGMAEDFLISMKLFISRVNTGDITGFRAAFQM